jgi:hypothetical protein
MRYLSSIAFLIVALSAPALADDGEGDAKAIMRQAAAEQADTVPPSNGPATEAAATAKSRADGQQGRLERNLRAASAEAHRAAIGAARAAAAGTNVPVTAGATGSPARAATTKSGSNDAEHRGAVGVAIEKSVRGTGHAGPPFGSGGKP